MNPYKERLSIEYIKSKVSKDGSIFQRMNATEGADDPFRILNTSLLDKFVATLPDNYLNGKTDEAILEDIKQWIRKQ